MKPFQYIVFIFLFLLFPSVTYAQTSYKVIAQRVNVRNKPSSQALVVGVVNKDEVVSVSEINNGWATFTFKGKPRYIETQYIEPVEKVTKPTEKPHKKIDSTKKDDDIDPAIRPTPSKLSDFRQRKKREKKVQNIKPRVSTDGQMTFSVDAFGGYSNFRCDEVSPNAGIGFGGDIGLQCDYGRIGSNLPKGLYLEVDLGYVCRGSGAYPIHYAEARVFPVGYRHPISPSMNIVGRVGGYVAYPFSEIKTSRKSYSTNLDFGFSAGFGVEWKRLGFMATYEHGFADVKEGGDVKLYNQGAFLTVSYKISTF